MKFLIGCMLIFAESQAFACSEVTVANGSTFAVSARCMDFPTIIPTLVEVSPRGNTTTSVTGGFTNPPLTWTAIYGGVYLTPSLEGSTTVVDGMNEMGLSCCLMWDGDSEYPPTPPPAGIPVLAHNLLPRYFLDNFATVSEAVDAIMNPSFYVFQNFSTYYGTNLPSHFTLHDKTGAAALLEFTSGSAVVYNLTQSPNYNVTTNEPQYPAQLTNANTYTYLNPGVMPPKGLPGDIDPESRFVRIAAFLSTTPISTLNPSQAVATAFGLIYTVVEPLGATVPPDGADEAWPTQWIRAYDCINLVNYYQAVDDKSFSVDVSKINFASPNVKRRAVNMYQPGLFGDITALLLLNNNF